MVVERKFASKADVVEKLLGRMSYKLVYTPKTLENAVLEIRDVKDYPIIYTAILEDVDVLVTGDRDFEDLALKRPEILTPTAFMERYG